MSIYFYQVFLALLGFTLFAALNNNGKSLKTIFLPSFLGVVAGVLIYSIMYIIYNQCPTISHYYYIF